MFWLILAAGAALLLVAKPKTAAPLLKLLSATPAWPKQRVAAFESGKHYFFALPIADDMSAPRRLASFAIALTLMGFQDVKVFPAKTDVSKADSPHPEDWASYPGVRCSGRWAGSAGQTFNLDLTKPFGGNSVIVWMSTEDFVNMHATKAN